MRAYRGIIWFNPPKQPCHYQSSLAGQVRRLRFQESTQAEAGPNPKWLCSQLSHFSTWQAASLQNIITP